MATFLTLQTELAARLSDTAHSVWTLAQKKRFLNSAIRNANEAGAYRLVVDNTTLDVLADTVEYSLPAALTKASNLWRVSVEIDTDTDYNYQDIDSWWVTENRAYSGGVESATLKLQLPQTIDGAVTAGNAIKLEYLAAHRELTADADTTSLPEEYLYAYAMFLANMESRNFADVDRKYHADEAQKQFQIAERYLKRYINQLPQTSGRVIPQVWFTSY